MQVILSNELTLCLQKRQVSCSDFSVANFQPKVEQSCRVAQLVLDPSSMHLSKSAFSLISYCLKSGKRRHSIKTANLNTWGALSILFTTTTKIALFISLSTSVWYLSGIFGIRWLGIIIDFRQWSLFLMTVYFTMIIIAENLSSDQHWRSIFPRSLLKQEW